jgi:hypothetical protein
VEESVRPCLRCDYLVESLSHYCPRCGNYLDKLKLVVPRPAAAAPVDGTSRSATLYGLFVAAAGIFGLTAIAAARWAVASVS